MSPTTLISLQKNPKASSFLKRLLFYVNDWMAGTFMSYDMVLVFELCVNEHSVKEHKFYYFFSPTD